jgi:uncharacterized membrane protein YgcG
MGNNNLLLYALGGVVIFAIIGALIKLLGTGAGPVTGSSVTDDDTTNDLLHTPTNHSHFSSDGMAVNNDHTSTTDADSSSGSTAGDSGSFGGGTSDGGGASGSW